MLAKTDHELAPGPRRGRLKRYARVKVVETVNAAIERGMRERGFRCPRI